jgi:type II secretory pathway pseudopilin PulG
MNRDRREKETVRSPRDDVQGPVRYRIKDAGGFQLLELLVVLGLIVSILGVTYELFIRQADAFRRQDRKVNRQQVLRASLEMISRDLRLAAYPDWEGAQRLITDLGIPEAYLPLFPLAVTLKEPVTIVSGGVHPDVISMLTVLPNENNPAVLAQEVPAGGNSLTLSLSASEVSDQYRVGDVLYVGKPPQFALVKAISGRSLTVDADSKMPGWQGLKQAQPSGTEAGEVSLVSYAVFTDQNDAAGHFHETGRPVLKRKINAGGFEPVAEDIAHLKIRPGPNGSYDLEIGALLEPGNETAAEREGQRLLLTSQVRRRN